MTLYLATKYYDESLYDDDNDDDDDEEERLAFYDSGFPTEARVISCLKKAMHCSVILKVA